MRFPPALFPFACGTAPPTSRAFVAIQGDRIYQRHTFDVPFFSQTTSFPLGPFILSQVSGAPILPAFVIRRRWLRYHVLMGDPIAVSRSGCKRDDAGLHEAMGEPLITISG